MMMFLTLLSICLLTMAVLSVVVYGTSSRRERQDVRPHPTLEIGAPRFFGGDAEASSQKTALPTDAVIAQIERHVRLEQAAAESFLELPAPETLHAPSASRFVN